MCSNSPLNSGAPPHFALLIRFFLQFPLLPPSSFCLALWLCYLMFVVAFSLSVLIYICFISVYFYIHCYPSHFFLFTSFVIHLVALIVVIFLMYNMNFFSLLFINIFYSYIYNTKFSSQFNFKLGRIFFNKFYSLSGIFKNVAKDIKI